jgi:hypothetical protein
MKTERILEVVQVWECEGDGERGLVGLPIPLRVMQSQLWPWPHNSVSVDSQCDRIAASQELQLHKAASERLPLS